MGDFQLQRLHVDGIESDLALQAIDFEGHDARLIGVQSGEVFVGLDVALQLSAHINTADETFQRTHVGTGDLLQRMRCRTANGLESFVGE